MRFHIQLTSFEQIKTFVALAARQPFAVVVGSTEHPINAKSLMAMLGLSYRHPLQVRADCDEATFAQFCRDAAQFLI